MVDLSSNIAVITINVNCLTISTKVRNWQSRLKKTQLSAGALV